MTLIFFLLTGRLSPASRLERQELQILEGSFGEQLNGQSATTSTSGNKSPKALTPTDFPEPFGPLTNNPPMEGLTAFSNKANINLS